MVQIYNNWPELSSARIVAQHVAQLSSCAATIFTRASAIITMNHAVRVIAGATMKVLALVLEKTRTVRIIRQKTCVMFQVCNGFVSPILASQKKCA
jgi:hypothetical protein